MKVFLTFLWFVFAVPVALRADERTLLIHGRDLLLAREYKKTEDFLERLDRQNEKKALRFFSRMAFYQTKNLDNFDYRFDSDYERIEKEGRRTAQSILQNREASSQDLLLAGGILGVSGFYRAHNSRWFAALRDGSSAIHALEKAYFKDPGQVDALFGIGLYDYWRSYYTRKLHFLPFFSDRRKEGREKLERVVREGQLCSVLAEVSLAFIDFKEQKYEQALKRTKHLAQKYPKNTILRMLLGQIFLETRQYDKAIREFETIRRIDPAITKANSLMKEVSKRKREDEK